jgi:hypothetical protein
MGRGVRGTKRRPYFHFNETEISVLFYFENVRPWKTKWRKTYWVSKELKKDFWKVQAACRSLYTKGFLNYDATNKCWQRQAGVDAVQICTMGYSPENDGSWSY